MSNSTQLLSILAIAALLLAIPANGQTSTVFTANYDLVLTAGEGTWHLTSRARVRSGNSIPVEAQYHRVYLQVTEADSNQITIAILVFEKSDDHWYQINADDLSFVADLGSPLEYKWESADISFDLAIIVGVYPHPEA